MISLQADVICEGVAHTSPWSPRVDRQPRVEVFTRNGVADGPGIMKEGADRRGERVEPRFCLRRRSPCGSRFDDVDRLSRATSGDLLDAERGRRRLDRGRADRAAPRSRPRSRARLGNPPDPCAMDRAWLSASASRRRAALTWTSTRFPKPDSVPFRLLPVTPAPRPGPARRAA